MDHDYDWSGGIHDSAPSCNNMKFAYSGRYTDPGWTWRPSGCNDTPRRQFTDGPFTSHATTIRAVHVTEIRERIDAQRVFYGLTAFNWTDPVIVSGVTPVKAVHVTELRTALAQAYMAAELVAPTYADDSVAVGVALRADHFSELHDAVVTLERGS